MTFFFFLDPQDDPVDDTGYVPSNCIRVLRVFLQLKNRRYLDDVMTKLGIDELEEYHYDPLEEDETAIDAKKTFYSVVGNCQDKAFACILRTKVFYFYISVLLFKLLYSPPNLRYFFSCLFREQKCQE